MEHSPPRKVIEIEAIDDDDSSMGNGPPFHFRLDPKADEEILFSFKIQRDTSLNSISFSKYGNIATITN